MGLGPGGAGASGGQANDGGAGPGGMGDGGQGAMGAGLGFNNGNNPATNIGKTGLSLAWSRFESLMNIPGLPPQMAAVIAIGSVYAEGPGNMGPDGNVGDGSNGQGGPGGGAGMTYASLMEQYKPQNPLQGGMQFDGPKAAAGSVPAAAPKPGEFAAGLASQPGARAIESYSLPSLTLNPLRSQGITSITPQVAHGIRADYRNQRNGEGR